MLKLFIDDQRSSGLFSSCFDSRLSALKFEI